MAKPNQEKSSDCGNKNPYSTSRNVPCNNNKRSLPRPYPKPIEEGSVYIVPNDSKKNEESPKIKVEYPLVPPGFELVDRHTEQPQSQTNLQQQPRNLKQEEHDSNTLIMGKTVYLMFEGEFEGGYLMNSVNNGDSSNPPLRGILFKSENSNESPKFSSTRDVASLVATSFGNSSPALRMSDVPFVAATGSLGTGYDIPDASLGINVVPSVATTALPFQGMNHASLEKEKNIPENINLKRSSVGALMSPTHLRSGTSMDFDFDKLVEEVSKRMYVGPYFDKLVDKVSKTIKGQLGFADSMTKINTMGKDCSTSRIIENAAKQTLQRFPPPYPDSSSRPSKRIKLKQDKTNEELGKKNKGAET